jgi:hypothetical protein
MKITRNIATLKLSAEEYITLAKAQSIILKIDDALEEEEYLSDGDFSKVSHSDIGTCYETLDFFLLEGESLENTKEETFYIEQEE